MRNNSLLFDVADIDIIKKMRNGIISFGIHEFSPEYPAYAYIELRDEGFVHISTTGEGDQNRFEVFTLKFEFVGHCPVRMREISGLSGSNQIFVLLREEWQEPFKGDDSQLVGVDPVTQHSGRPGAAPKDAITKAIVAGGVLIFGDNNSLLILSDIFPKTVQIIVDGEIVNKWLELHEKIELNDYIVRFGGNK
jgi:hypothetical protein